MSLPLPQQPVYVVIPSPLPTIESNRLLLRPVLDSDAAALLAVRGRPEVAEHQYPTVPFASIEETLEWLSTKTFAAGPPDIIGRSFNYVIVDKSISESESEPNRHQVIGYVSVNTVDPCPEIGYSLVPEAWGNGYTTEALQLALKMWWELPRRRDPGPGEESEKIFALTTAVNLGSCRVLEKCGFSVRENLQYEEIKLYLWELERPVQ